MYEVMQESALSANLQAALAVLPSLNRVELEQLRTRASWFIQHRGGSEASSAAVEDEDWLLRGLLVELERRGLDGGRDFQIKRASSFAGFSTQSAHVRGLLLQASSVELSAVQRRALGEVAAQELCRYIEGWRPPVSVSRDALLRHVGRVPEAVDRAYPGYLEAGLLGLVIKQRRL